MGMFGRKHHEEQSVAEVAPTAPAPSVIPDYGFNLPKEASPKTVTDLQRTSSYPHGMDGRARFTAHERTTSYRQPMYSDRRVYDTIN